MMKKTYEAPSCNAFEFAVEDLLQESKITNEDEFPTGGETGGGGNYDDEGGTGSGF